MMSKILLSIVYIVLAVGLGLIHLLNYDEWYDHVFGTLLIFAAGTLAHKLFSDDISAYRRQRKIDRVAEELRNRM